MSTEYIHLDPIGPALLAADGALWTPDWVAAQAIHDAADPAACAQDQASAGRGTWTHYA